MPEEILELSALVPERPKARLRTEADPEGQIYELAAPADFGAVSLARVGRLISETEELWGAAKRSSAQDRRLEKLLDQLASALVPEAPAESIAALPAFTKRALGVRFLAEGGEALKPILGKGSALI
jgi:hypothetical protein